MKKEKIQVELDALKSKIKKNSQHFPLGSVESNLTEGAKFQLTKFFTHETFFLEKN